MVTLRNYYEFVQTQLQGFLAGIPVTSVSFFSLKVNLHVILYPHLICFICMLHFLASSSEKDEDEEKNPPPSHARGFSSFFMETYPYFPAWQYEVMNLDGLYSSMALDRLEHTLNVPWGDLVHS